MDRAACNYKRRPLLLASVGSERCTWEGDRGTRWNYNDINWLFSRKIKIRPLKCKNIFHRVEIVDDMAVKIGSFGPHLRWLSITGEFVGDAYIVKILIECPILEIFRAPWQS